MQQLPAGCRRLLDSPDSWRTANGVDADPGSPTTRHGAGRSLDVERRSGALLHDHDRDHGVRAGGCCSAIGDGCVCTGAPGSCHGRAGATLTRVLH